jgi:hypothetical protein
MDEASDHSGVSLVDASKLRSAAKEARRPEVEDRVDLQLRQVCRSGSADASQEVWRTGKDLPDVVIDCTFFEKVTKGILGILCGRPSPIRGSCLSRFLPRTSLAP